MAERDFSLEAEFQRLETQCKELEQLLSEAVRGMGTGDVYVPDDALAKKIRRVGKAYDRLADHLVPGLDLVVSKKDGQSKKSLGGLRRMLDHHLREKNKKRDDLRRARKTVERVLALRHVSEGEFEPLTAVLNQATELKSTLAESNRSSDVELLVAGTHPFCHLLALIDGCKTLADAEHERLWDAVADAFDRPLANAATRGRLVEGEAPSIEVQKETEREYTSGSEKNLESEPTPTYTPVVPPKPAVAKSDPDPSLEPTSQTKRASGPASTPVETKVERADPPPRGRVHTEPDVASLLWSLIKSNRLSLAYHLANSLEALDGSPIPPDALCAALLCRHVRSASAHEVRSETAERYREAVSPLCDETVASGAHGDALRLVLIAASLRPSLVAPGSAAASLLRSHSWAGALGSLIQVVREYSGKNLRIRPGMFAGALKRGEWENELSAFRRRARDWRDQNRVSQLNYGPATRVWHSMLADDGPVGSLLGVIIGGRIEKPQLVEGVKKLLDRKDLQHAIDTIDRTHRKKKAAISPIRDKALKMLMDRAAHAAELIEDWLGLLAREPQLDRDWHREQASECRNSVLALIPDARNELQQDAVRRDNVPRASAATFALSALTDLEHLFATGEHAAMSEPQRCHMILGADLVAVPGLQLDETWMPTVAPDVARDILTEAACREAVALEKAFDLACERGDHRTTLRILDQLEIQGRDSGELEEIAERRDADLRSWREGFPSVRAKVEAALGRAASEGLFDAVTLEERRNTVAAMNSEEILDFAAAQSALDAIADEISSLQGAKAEELRKQLDATGLRDDDAETYARIETLLQRRDFPTANEYLTLIADDRPLPEGSSGGRTFDRFFPPFVAEYDQFVADVRRPPARDFVQGVRDRVPVGPLSLEGVGPEAAEDAARLLEAWLAVRDGRAAPDTRLQEILEGLGFREPSFRKDRSTKRRWHGWLRCAPVRDRDICVIPAYGSSAKGEYQLVCVLDRHRGEDLLQIASAGRGRHATIVLYFAHLGVADRRRLAHRCRERQETLLVIDDALMYSLCGVPGKRLASVFQCGLPFTTARPYTTTAGSVAEEMFFGRDRERKEIASPSGTSLVYGGRQLGKTALLRDVVRRYHDPRNGSIVQWIDLQRDGIGKPRPADEIWSPIARALRDVGIVRGTTAGPKAIRTQLESWLAKGSRRRVLLLLDESDAFLDMDGQNSWQNLKQLKGLMELTDRRFKVVFAGLHNVQRTARDVNTSIAHLGSPICVGPLLEGGEVQEACRLVEMPLGMLGYRFESPDLVMKVLSHTNFYPSLIQLFCMHLLEHLDDSSSQHFDERKTPPYLITARHVQEAYDSEELQRAIRERFMWTLDLDPRYRVMALALALESFEADRGANFAYEVAQVRDLALGWWDAGFSDDRSLEAFHTLLDEMVGLGVLRRLRGKSRYALRNANIMQLLGTRESIEAQLEEAMSAAAPPKYEAQTYRRPRPDATWHRSPLTAEQEYKLVDSRPSVSLVFGAPIAGLDDVGAFLREFVRTSDGELVEIARGSEFAELRDPLVRLKRSGVGRMRFFVVQPEAWTSGWLADTLDAVEALGTRPVHVLFLGNPNDAWSWEGVSAKKRGIILGRDLRVMSLRPWRRRAVEGWLRECGFGPGDEEGRERVREATGHWGELLHEFAQSCQTGLWDRQLERIGTDAQKLRTRFGLIPEVECVLEHLADLGPATEEDLREFLEGADAERVPRVLRWAESLHLIKNQGEGAWAVDPVLHRALAKPS